MNNYIYEFIYMCLRTKLNSTGDESIKYDILNKVDEQLMNNVCCLTIGEVNDIVNTMDLNNLSEKEMILFLIYLYESKQHQALRILDQLQYDIHNIFQKGKFVEKDIYDTINTYKSKIKKEVD